MTTKMAALLIGISILVMAISAGVAYGYVHGAIVVPADAYQTFEHLTHQRGLMLLGLACWGIIVVCDLLTSVGLIVFFNPIHRKAAYTIGGLRLCYTGFLIIAVIRLSTVLFAEEATQAFRAILLFEKIWSLGLIVFGFHLFFWGYFSGKLRVLPKVLSISLLVAGIGYTLIHTLKNLPISFSIEMLEVTLAVPMTLAELGLAVWMLVKGRKLSFSC